MRQIKFRAWDGEKYWDIMDNSKVVLEFCKISGWNIVPNQPNYSGKYLAGESINKIFVLEQFTGLTDKNGKEIYEGDIVKYEVFVKINESRFYNGIIEWWSRQLGVGWRYRSGKTTFMLKTGNVYKMEIIGNIHEHKNLIKP